MDHTTTVAPQARLFVGMGGSGIKTLHKFADLLTEHSGETARSEVFMAYLLVDTDNGELAEYAKKIREAYKRVHREPIVKIVNLSADITDFSAFVSTTLTSGGNHDRLREIWWYRTNSEGAPQPFTAINLKDSPTAGAGQCPQVSTFLAWNRMGDIDRAIEELLNDLKNRSTQGKNMQNWNLDVAMVASLAGGTGRGCWHLVASKIRDKLRDLNQRPKPVGFFFDSSIFAEDVKREEQVMKLQVNSITGVSELIAWLRNEYERETDLLPYQFRLPSLDNPGLPSSDLIDTSKLNLTVDGSELPGTTGRSPVSAAYLIFSAGKQGTLGSADSYYHSVASALYARLFRSTISKTINEAGHLNGLGSATISVPINGIRAYVQSYVRQFLPTRYSQPLDDSKITSIVNAFLQGIDVPESIPPFPKNDSSNVHQRLYAVINDKTSPTKEGFDSDLQKNNHSSADNHAQTLTNWATGNNKSLTHWVDDDIRRLLWGTYVNNATATGGALQHLVPEAFKKAIEPDAGKKEKVDSLLEVVFNKGKTSHEVNPVSEAIRLLLNASTVELQGATQKERLDIGSYGTKRAIASRLVETLRKTLESIDKNEAVGKSAGSKLNSPMDELKAARTGFMKAGVTLKERKAILESIDPWLIRTCTGPISTRLRSILQSALNETDSLAKYLEAIEKKLAGVAKSEEKNAERMREVYFWGEGDFERVLDADTSAFDKQVLSAQKLQPVTRDKELRDKFEETIKKHSLMGFEEAKQHFVDAMKRWIGNQAGKESPELRKLTDIIDHHLGSMVDQFMLPADFYADTFGFFATVKQLMGEWGKKMQQRAASPQDLARLKQVFENQFGLPFPESSDKTPKELEDDDEKDLAERACRAMAIRLGGRTDPLFQQRFDEGERPTYDSVGVVLPTEEIFDKDFAKDIDEEARLNPQFSASGQFKATPTFDMLDAGNPYTMFAYATQQFEDWRRESGMARIASLEYYKTPAVLAWLKACEDPAGASVFLDGEVLKRDYGIPSHKDIYGLGYISPLFLHDKTLREFRWSPWDQFKRRSADKGNEVLDLLAYALLDVPRNVSTKHFQYFVRVLDKANWQMPLLTWQASSSGDAPSLWVYKRPAVRHCTEVLRTKERDATHPAFPAGHTNVSIRKCLEEIHENESVAAAIAGEATIFITEVLCNKDFADEFAADTDISLAFRYLGDRLKEARAQEAGPAAERMQKVIDDLLRRVAVLETYSPEELRERYDSIRRNSELPNRA
jgi:hypothetical protein